MSGRQQVDPARVPVRPAATVMLLRDTTDGLQVFVLQRVAQMAFAGGMTAFPGGGVDPSDSASVGWRGPGPAWFAEQFGAGVELAGSIVVTAVRELFEEVGVLLADVPPGAPAADPATRERLRERVAAHQIGLDGMLGGGVIRADLLRPWARWITPVGPPRRYDTFFLTAALPAGTCARAVTSEAESGSWVHPAAALAAGERGEITVMPPTAAMLTDLAGFDTVDDVLAQRREIQQVGPERVSRPGGPLRVRVAGREYRYHP